MGNIQYLTVVTGLKEKSFCLKFSLSALFTGETTSKIATVIYITLLHVALNCCDGKGVIIF